MIKISLEMVSFTLFDVSPDPTFHFDADPDPIFQIKAQNSEKVLK